MSAEPERPDQRQGEATSAQLPPSAHNPGPQRRKAPLLLWPLVVLVAVALSFEFAANLKAGLTPNPDAAADTLLSSLSHEARVLEVAVSAGGEEVDRSSLQSLALDALTVAEDAQRPPLQREKAFALWVMFWRAGSPDEATAPLCGPAAHDALSRQLPSPDARSALGRVLASLCSGSGTAPGVIDAEDRDALMQVDLSPWLRSRIDAFLSAPREALDPTGAHARTERVWAGRLLTIVSIVGLLGLAGLGMLVVHPFVRRRMTPSRLAAETSLPGADQPWAPWMVLVCWLGTYLVLGFGLSLVASQFEGAAAWRSALQVLIQLGAGAVALGVIARTTGGLDWLTPGLTRFDGRMLPPVTWAVSGFAVAVPVVFGLGYLSSLLPIADPTAAELRDALLNPGSSVSEALFIVSVIMLAPFFEELVFRDVLYRHLRLRIGPMVAAVVSALLFAFIHANPVNLLPLFGLGLVLAYLVERSGSVLPAMLVHLFWNGNQLLLMRITADT